MTNIHVIWDGNNTCFRADCVSDLRTKDGLRSAGIYGTLNILHNMFTELPKVFRDKGLGDVRVTDNVFCWDMGHSKRRTTLFPEYKAGRNKFKDALEEELKKAQREEFIQQTNALHTFLPALGVRSLRFPGWEGDDIIYTVTRIVQGDEWNGRADDLWVIVSTDEDFHQLISDNVYLYSPIKEVLYTPDNYAQLRGFPLSGFITYKILKGDTSDGIPGIQGIGDKTAAALVNQYGDMSNMLKPENFPALRKSARTARILTPEGLQTLQRNNQLINLSYVDYNEIYPQVFTALIAPTSIDASVVRQFMLKYQLMSIISTLGLWMQEFQGATTT